MKETQPKCMQCKFYYVTYDPKFPRGCKLFGIKSWHMPTVEVKRVNGVHCPKFKKR